MRELLIILAAVLALAGVIFFMTDQSRSYEPSPNIHLGERYTIGDGYAYTWIEMGPTGQLKEIGINVTDAAINSLPEDEHVHQFSMSLPDGADTGPFSHVLLDWSFVGHEPPGIYDLPHFDAHFYVASEADRMAIGLEDPEHDIGPDGAYIPENYDKIPGGVPQMGAHWVDVTSPEFHDEVFTETFIYGSYDGKVTFLEPMFTREYLESKPNMTRAIPSPHQIPDGWDVFPTLFTLTYDEVLGEYSISLHGFIAR